jgi:hypothetical protein
MAEEHTQDRPGAGAPWSVHRGLAALVALALLGGIAILLFFNPSEHSFYPICLLHATTGLQCPGCGSLRALHQILHGNVVAAFKFNPITVLAVPLAIVIAIRMLVLKMRGKSVRFEVRPLCLWAIVGLLILFTFIRNFVMGPDQSFDRFNYNLHSSRG